MPPKVVLITTGGTIASRIDPETGGVRPAARGHELLAMAPGLDRVAEIELQDLASVNGWNMSPATMFEAARRVNAALARPDVAGAVVTHGTDTLEETAYMVDLLLQGEKPVVFTGAMRNISYLGYDGPANLMAAAQVAAAPQARGYGTMVVLNDQIHAARWVTKTHTTNLDTFRSPDYGPLGIVAYDGVRFQQPAPRRQTLHPAQLVPEVWLLTMATGVDGRPLRAALAAGAQGIVIEGTGAGNVPDAVVPAIAEAQRQGLPVVLTSRCYQGPLSPTYGSPGGGHSLKKMGIIMADQLNGQKARIKLMLALGQTRDLEAIRAIFAEGE